MPDCRESVMASSDDRKLDDLGYYDYDRSDVLAMVPGEAKRILSIGCGSGTNEARLKERGAFVAGIELCEEAAARARERLDQVVTGDVETMDSLPWPPGSFDCVICADVLEHLRRPEDLLRKIHDVLSPGGHVVISVPNSRNWKVLRQLVVKGDYPYEDQGLFDRTHVRMLTVRSMTRMLAECGFEVTRKEFTYLYPRRLRFLFRLMAGCCNACREMMVFHILLTARRTDRGAEG
jgi:2-polyprenyl-3-methyl-5-hydroxy-6-metoxy-1,4-benzoquinol methylase